MSKVLRDSLGRPLVVSVKCQLAGCGWTLEVDFEQIPDWHNKPCPQCHAGTIIDDDDLTSFKEFRAQHAS